jgi:hypothetical protein
VATAQKFRVVFDKFSVRRIGTKAMNNYLRHYNKSDLNNDCGNDSDSNSTGACTYSDQATDWRAVESGSIRDSSVLHIVQTGSGLAQRPI